MRKILECLNKSELVESYLKVNIFLQILIGSKYSSYWFSISFPFLQPLPYASCLFLISFYPEERIEDRPAPPVRGAVSSPAEVSYSHPTITPSQGDLSGGLQDATKHPR